MELLVSHLLTSPCTSSSSLLLKTRVRVSQTALIPPRFQQLPLCSAHPRHILSPMDARPSTVTRASLVKDNDSPITPSTPDAGARIGEVKRVTKETNVAVRINLDGLGIADSSTGIPFLDHMMDQDAFFRQLIVEDLGCENFRTAEDFLGVTVVYCEFYVMIFVVSLGLYQQLAAHGLFDVYVRATGDIHIDDHHTNEDVALAIGTALLHGLGDRKGINRFGDSSAPLDEALIHVSLDLSGRPHLSYDLRIPTERVGTYDTQLVEHFFQSMVNTSGMTLHIRQLAGKNSHHIIEATFKAFARALRQATEYDPRRRGTVPRFDTFSVYKDCMNNYIFGFFKWDCVENVPSFNVIVIGLS
ncbi:hypothetical protein RHSIM_Rhsim02G0024500 [Rhododendron simsii]|uniref:Imidazoleglycerol-phosphate dehydratase n=1 Tax=Rhododendron simsii TaxID=118357 RepID=A0A834H9L8_RHOSS|nr:hypothetical protein RHSIM_Rhsim02G0024500 [Rhododendron simsii]